MTCHMEYTESLQAPPGPQEAGKLLQSLAWPDWKPAGYLQADLAACERCPSPL